MYHQTSYEDYRRQGTQPPLVYRHSSDYTQRARSVEPTASHHQRTVSATSYTTSRPSSPQQYRSSPKPQHRSVLSPQQRARSPAPHSPLEKDRAPRRREKPNTNVPPVSKFSYEPYRANSSVFEESEDDILARKKAAKAAKASKSNAKFGLFGSGKKTESVTPEPVRPYLHRAGSGDSLELMPTIAMGYENSMDKQMRHRQMPGGELRITGNGYYFQAEEEEEEDDEMEDVHEAYKQNIDEERTDTSPTELQKPAFIERERSLSRGRGAESPNREISRSRSVSRHQESRAVEESMQIKEKKESKKLGLFKKWLGSDKSRKSKKKEKKEKKNLTDAHNILFDERGTPLDLTVEGNQDISEMNSPITPSTGSPLRTTFDITVEEEEPIDENVEDPETLVGVMGSIPVLSAIFAKINESEHLSEQTKLVIKLGIVVWLMYEMQMIYDAVGRVFGG